MSAGNLKGTETIFHSHKNADEKAEHIYMCPNMHYMITWIPDKSEELHSTNCYEIQSENRYQIIQQNLKEFFFEGQYSFLLHYTMNLGLEQRF